MKAKTCEICGSKEQLCWHWDEEETNEGMVACFECINHMDYMNVAAGFEPVGDVILYSSAEVA